jgi:hypothetical protein
MEQLTTSVPVIRRWTAATATFEFFTNFRAAINGSHFDDIGIHANDVSTDNSDNCTNTLDANASAYVNDDITNIYIIPDQSYC